MVRSTLNLLCSLFLISSFAGASPLDVKVKTIDGTKTTLGATKPRVVLVVNTASKCGFTRQYEELQALHEKYGEKGLLIAGFPCNQFGGQEPGSEKDIQQFCAKNFGVSFLLAEN